MHLRPDGKVLASGSADKEVKFWEFEQEAMGEDEVSQCFLECDFHANATLFVEPPQEIIGASAYTHPQDVRRCTIAEI